MVYLRRGACVAVLCCVTLVGLCGAPAPSRSRSNAGRTGRQSGGSSRGRFPTTCADRTTFKINDTDLQSRPYKFQCPRRGQITEVKAVGVKDACRGSTPLLQSIESGCSWNRSCTLESKVNDIVTRTVTEDDVTCLGQHPTSFHVAYTCLKRNADVKDVLGNFQRTTKRVGVARSHNLFPWSYRNGQQLGNLTIVRPRKPTNLRTLWLTVKTLSLLDSDLLFLSWDDNSDANNNVDALRVITPEDVTFPLEGVQQVVLTLYADYALHHSAVGGEEKGFVLCYQWLPAGSRPKKMSACSKVMKPAKCRTRSAGQRNRNSGSRGRGGARRTRNRQ